MATKRKGTKKAAVARKAVKPAVKAARKPPAAKPKAKPAPAPAPAAAPPPPPPSAWVWHEVMTSDVAVAKRFYGALMGWAARDASMTTGPYTIFSKHGADVAGCMPIPVAGGQPACPPNWMAYARVDDVDAVAERCKALGGKVEHGPMDIPSVGRFAVLSDPAGAVFAIFKPGLGC